MRNATNHAITTAIVVPNGPPSPSRHCQPGASTIAAGDNPAPLLSLKLLPFPLTVGNENKLANSRENSSGAPHARLDALSTIRRLGHCRRSAVEEADRPGRPLAGPEHTASPVSQMLRLRPGH
jgi:hypothetical protein